MEAMIQRLKQQFYDVMYKYEKPFAETGVLANLNQWATAKRPLLELLRHHPNWQEEDLAVVMEIQNVRPIDRDAVDEGVFALRELGEEMQLPAEQRKNLYGALCAAITGYEQLMPDNDNYLDTIRSLTGIPCVAGQKTSRVINRICCQFGLDQYTVERPDAPGQMVHPYNAIFARLSDALNPPADTKKLVLSIHPCDFLEMSGKNSTWKSCHRLNGGSYQAGCQSYMGDGVSMVLFVVEPDQTGPYGKVPHLNRQIFCYGDGLLLQSRLYPERNDDANTIYRHTVQAILATCLQRPNQWKVKRDIRKENEFWHTVSQSCHYPDYDHGYAILSLLKGQDSYTPLKIGSVSLCTVCGQPKSESSRLQCTQCEPVAICAACGKTLPMRDLEHYEGKFYCKDCLYWCSVCRKYHLGTPRKVFGRRGQEKSVCPDCYRNVADTCRGCLIHEQCLDFGGNRFCPTAYEGLAA